MEVTAGFAQIGPAKLYYELAGEGQPMVMIHAGVADSRQWNDEFAIFSETHQVLRYDQRGFGQSVPVDTEFSFLSDLLGVLDQAGISRPVILVGCSMGGSLAMDFTLEHPERVKGLIMVGSGPSGLRLDVPDHPKQAAAEEAYLAGDLDRVPELEAQIWFDGMGRSKLDVDPTVREFAVEMNRLALDHEALGLGTRKPNTETPASERLEQVEVPVLIMVGEHDIPYSHAAADHLVSALTDARKVVLPDAAHLPNLDHPDRFQREVSNFLGDLAQSG